MNGKELLIRFIILIPAGVLYLIAQAFILNELIPFFPFASIFEPHTTIAMGIFFIGATLLSSAWLFPILVQPKPIQQSLAAFALALAIIAIAFSIGDPYRLQSYEVWLGPSELRWSLNPILREAGGMALVVMILRAIGATDPNTRQAMFILAPAIIVALAVGIPILLGYPAYLG